MTEEVDTTDTTFGTLSFEQAETLFTRGIIGTIEFRNWLARRYPDFATVRDDDVDKSIKEIAQRNQKRMEAQALLGD